MRTKKYFSAWKIFGFKAWKSVAESMCEKMSDEKEKKKSNQRTLAFSVTPDTEVKFLWTKTWERHFFRAVNWKRVRFLPLWKTIVDHLFLPLSSCWRSRCRKVELLTTRWDSLRALESWTTTCTEDVDIQQGTNPWGMSSCVDGNVYWSEHRISSEGTEYEVPCRSG